MEKTGMEATRIEQPPMMRLKGSVLLLEREKRGLSQASLAKKMNKLGVIGITQRGISRWETDTEFCIGEYEFNILVKALEF